MKNNILTPSYTKEFKCIGGECEDSCCIGWNVSIDKNTFKNYKKIYDKDFKKKIDKYVKRNRHSTNENDYAQIKLLQNKRCPFLNNENLCEVFINIGENNLSKVCTKYPRIYNKVDGNIEKSLTLSCPTAAKKILLNKNLMEFDQIESEEPITVINKDINTTDSKDYLHKYFWDLRVFTIDLLQNREYSLEDRLIILGMFCSEINQHNNISHIIEKFKNRLESKVYKDFLNEISGDIKIKLSILSQTMNVTIEQEDMNDFFDLCNKSMEGLESNDCDNLEEAYKRCYENYYKDFISDKEYIYENFLVNYVFYSIFPLNEKNIFDQYILMVVYFSLIKFYLIGLSAYYKNKFSEETVACFIQKFCKYVLHSNMYIQWIFNIIKENNFDSMAHMAIFIKH